MTQGDQSRTPLPGQPIPVPLEYQRPASDKLAEPRPKWVYAIITSHLLLLVGLLTMPAWATWLFNSPDMRVQLGLCVSVLVIAGLTLMIVPVRAVRQRRVTRRSVWFPIIGSGLLIALLFFGGGMAFEEFLNENGNITNQLLIAAGIIWVLWSGIFILITFSVDPAGIGMKLHRWLVAGSVLELLVAVPTHLVVPRRTDCCVGIATGMGICICVAVMFVAFGPSVLLLYCRRHKQITGR